MKRVFCSLVFFSLYLGAVGQARSNFIYWSNILGGDIRRANLDGTGQTTLVTGQDRPIGPALDLANGRMYWGNVGSSSIRQANLDGTSQTNVLTGFGGGGLALDLVSGRMYFAKDTGNIHRANLDGTGVTTLVTGQKDPHNVRLHLAAGHMYWPEQDGGAIRRANLDGTGLTTLVTGQPQPSILDLDLSAGQIYWTNAASGDIRRANLDGSGQEILVQGLSNPAGITLDVSGGKMYWSNIGSGDIRRANLDGSAQEMLIRGLPGPVFIALDLTKPGLTGDYNADGTVDAADYVVWRNGLGTTYAQDGYDSWRADFGASSGDDSRVAESLRDTETAVSEKLPYVAAVPEPASIALLLTGLAAITLNSALLRRPRVSRLEHLKDRHV